MNRTIAFCLFSSLLSLDAFCFPAAMQLPPTARQGYYAQGSQYFESVGAAVADVGDINGDGRADFAITSVPPVGAGPTVDHVYVIFDVASLSTGGLLDLSKIDGVNGVRFDAPSTYALGASISHCDFDGDGHQDLIIGAPGYIPSNLPYGAAYVIYGHNGSFPASINVTTLTPNTGFRIVGDHNYPYGYAGAIVAGVGDFDGDGRQDIVLSAPLMQLPAADGTGAVYLVYGRAARPQSDIDLGSLSVHHAVRFQGPDSTSEPGYLGNSLAAIGDVNGDGKPDFAFGCIPTVVTTGCIVFGGATLPAVTDVTTLAPPVGTLIVTDSYGVGGVSLFAPAGDVNGDGIADFIVGGGGPTAIATVIYGRMNGFGASINVVHLDGSMAWQITAGSWGSGIQSVSGGRDVDGDGKPDILLGVRNGGPLYGEYSYLLSPRSARTGFTTDLASLSGPNGMQMCATQISGGNTIGSLLGDVTGDGLSDMIVGIEDGYPRFPTNAGGAFILAGSDRIFGDVFDAATLTSSQVCSPF